MSLNFTEQKIKNLVLEINKLEGKVPEHLVNLLFSIHNSLYPNSKEYNKGCSICRSRTFNRVQTYYNQNILN